MNKTELISEVSERNGVSFQAADSIVNSLFDIITDELVLGHKVQVTGFGVFEVTERAAREAHNPSSGEKVFVPKKTVARFRAGKLLRDAVDKWYNQLAINIKDWHRIAYKGQ